ncbi:MAG: 5'/3'-nucleotidase SurE [Candidatus Melainabacteria bacterium]|nr:5'/3'-nucleotidase SurE [Candidatus Melainabacteria bacterium]
MKILVSNDDGIHARGIQALIEALAPQYEVYVVAPDRENSAMGHALTLHSPLRIQEVTMAAPVKAAYSVSGTPSDCVKIALNILLEEPMDVVVSGINHGPNLGADVVYSGTVSAAFEGTIGGLPSVAVSLMNGFEKSADFSHAAQFICQSLPRMLSLSLPPRTILNVNVPAESLNHLAGVRVTQLGTRMYKDTYERRTDPRGQLYYWLVGEEVVAEADAEDADVKAIQNNYISITPVSFDLTCQPLLGAARAVLDQRF